MELPKFEDTEETLPAFEETAELPTTQSAALPAFNETAELPKFEDTIVADKPTIGQSVVTGLKEVFVPSMLTKDEYKREQDIGNVVTQVGTSLGVGIAANIAAAKAGAAVGTAIAPGLGTAIGAIAAPVALNLYQAIGGVLSRSEAEGVEASPQKMLAAIALEANPLVKGGNKTVTALRVLGQGAVAAGLEKSYDKDTSDSSLGVIAGLNMLGAAIGIKTAPLKSGMSGIKLTDEYKKGMADVLTDNSLGITEKATKEFTNIKLEDKLSRISKIDRGVEAVRFNDILGTLPKDVRKSFLKTKDINVLEGVELGEDELNILSKVNEIKRDKGSLKGLPRDVADNWHKLGQEDKIKALDSVLLGESITKVAEKEIRKIDKRLNDPILPVLRLFEDPLKVFEHVDDQLGTTFSRVADGFSEAQDKITNATLPFAKRFKDLEDISKKAGLDLEDLGKAKINGTKLSNPEHQAIADQWGKLYDDTHKFLSENGFKIGYEENYLNVTKLDPSKISIKLDQAKKELAELDTGDMSLHQFFKEQSNQSAYPDLYNKFRDIQKLSSGYDGPVVQTLQDIGKLSGDVLDGSKKLAHSKDKAFSLLYSKEDTLPERFREFDIGKNYLQYLSNNTKTVFMRDSIEELNRNIDAARIAGMDKFVDYATKYRDNILGRESGLKAWAEARAHRAAKDFELLSENDSDWKKLSTTARKRIADYSGLFTGVAYRNLLANPKTAVRDLTQPLLFTAPYLGKLYGPKLMLQAYGDVAKLGIGGAKKFLTDRGMTSDNRALQHLKDGIIEGSKARSKGAEMLEEINDKLMWMNKSADVINRAVTAHMGDRWAREAVAGDKGALKALERLASSYKTKIKVEDLVKDEKKLGDMLGRYLISSTQMHYGKTQMNEMGRAGGALFSMFSKWPSRMGSEVLYTLRSNYHGTGKNRPSFSSTFLAPLAMLGAAQAIRSHATNDGNDENALVTYFLGDDLTKMAPISAAKDFASLGSASHPLAGGAKDVAIGAGKAVDKLLQGEIDLDSIFDPIVKTVETFDPSPTRPIMNTFKGIKKADTSDSLNIPDWMTGKFGEEE